MRLRCLHGWLAGSVVYLLAGGAIAQTTLDEVVVSASRAEQRVFDAPGSIDLVDRRQIELSGPQVNVSEALGLVPGINVADRSNYAQDLQVSIRGFGSRAPFGVRGVRLMVDGLPITLPDGQGQTSQFSATSTNRIEVLKGPMASLYGNASGGLIQAFTRDPSDSPELIVKGFYGSDELKRGGIQYSETRSQYGLVFDYGALSSTGFRQYSAAERDHFNVKLVRTSESGKTTLIANSLDQKQSQDPGSLTLSEFQSNPHQAVAANVTNRAGKTFFQNLVGVVDDHNLGAGDRLRTRLYAASRALDNPGNNAFTFIVIDRLQWGTGLEWASRTQLGGAPIDVLLGYEFDRVTDARAKFNNTAGLPSGAIKQDEDNLATSHGLYAQGAWLINDGWTLTAGLRYASVKNEIRDYYLTDVDGSGSKTYSGFIPVVGVTRHVDEWTNWYLNVGGGFETPTLNEVIYIYSGGAGSAQFNPDLNAARSVHIETGVKRKASTAQYSASVFMTRTKDDVTPYYLSTSSSTWQNLDTQRLGVELAYAKELSRQLSLEAGFSVVQGTYREAGSTVGGSYSGSFNSGARLPGIPEDKLRVDLVYRPRGDGLASGGGSKRGSEFGLEFTSVGKIYVNSLNSQRTSRYSLINLRASQSVTYLGGEWTALARINNLTDRVYAASIIGDRSDGRYYEPGAPRNFLVGLTYTAKF